MHKRRFSLDVNSCSKSLHLLFITFLFVLVLGTAPTSPAHAEPLPSSGAAMPAWLINSYGSLDNTRPAAPPIAWNALGENGLNGQVNAIVAYEDDLYVGGQFTATGDGSPTGLGNIARYDIINNTWHALPEEGLNGDVAVLALIGDDLYVGGKFTATGDGSTTPLGYIARYDITDNSWNVLKNDGLSGDSNAGVRALIVSGNDLYVGGRFNQSGDGNVTGLNYIARYNTTGIGNWYALADNGLDNVVNALAVSGNDLYVGGHSTKSFNGNVPNLNCIARYDMSGGAWYALKKQGLKSAVMALAISGSDLYAGGIITQIYDGSITNLGNIVHYDTDTESWSALDNDGLSFYVYTLAVSGGDLYVGGHFASTGDGSVTGLNSIARYTINSGPWHKLPEDGLKWTVFTLVVSGNNLFVGGNFTETGDGSLKDLGRIVRLSLKAEPKKLLSVTLKGNGSGTVTSLPAGINCGQDCSESYATGTEVTLKAAADTRSVFKGWSGDCSGFVDCKVTMNSDKSVTANFEEGLLVLLPTIFR